MISKNWLTIPCRPRIIDGVDENKKCYEWAMARGYKFIRFDHSPVPGVEAEYLSWVLLKEEEVPDPPPKKPQKPPADPLDLQSMSPP